MKFLNIFSDTRATFLLVFILGFQTLKTKNENLSISKIDFKNKTHAILYTFPIQKQDYFLGKFFSAFLIVVFITFSYGMGVAIAEHLPNLNQSQIGDFKPFGYLQAYGL